MSRRMELQTKLEALLGSKNVYFQPPENARIKYPCLIYEYDGIDAEHADDLVYNHKMKYEAKYITKDPDCEDFINSFITSFKYCRYIRHYVNDNLNHEVFNLYY